MAWDDDKKAKAIEMYEEREPTPANSMEIVKEIAEELDESANGVRMILTRAGVYVKKEETKSATNGGSGGANGGTKKLSKEDAHKQLTTAIEDAGGKVDSEIISKLTGKAAVYLAEVIKAAGEK